MTAIILRNFGGIAPAVPPRYLSAQQAQVAQNLRVFNAPGPLDALRDVSPPVWPFTKIDLIESIYRFGDGHNEQQYWFHWPGDVDVVRGFIADDASQRTFFTGDGIPKATDVTLALTGGGNQYPVAAYMLGVPKPDIQPIVTNNSGLPDSNLLAETRVYTYTFVNSWGEESIPFVMDPMPGSAQVTLTNGQTVLVELPEPPSGPFNLTKRRIYRSQVGTASVQYLFVAEIPIAQTSFYDSVSAAKLGEACPSITWLPPKPGLRGLVAMANGILAGFTGHDIYLCEPFRPFAFPEQYHNSVGFPVVGLGVMDTTLAILTTAKPYFLQGGHPDSMVLVEADIPQACVSKRSIVSLGGSVLYASPDGLVRLAPGGSSLVTQGFFDREQWQELNPASIHAYAHDGKYIAFYEDVDGHRGGFIMDPSMATFTLHDIYVEGGYTDLLTDTLYLSDGNAVVKWDGGAKVPYRWRSKLFTYPQPVGFSCIRVEAETYPVECDVTRDGVLIASYNIVSPSVLRLPAGKGRNWELELRGTGQVYSAGIAEAPVELAGG